MADKTPSANRAEAKNDRGEVNRERLKQAQRALNQFFHVLTQPGFRGRLLLEINSNDGLAAEVNADLKQHGVGKTA